MSVEGDGDGDRMLTKLSKFITAHKSWSRTFALTTQMTPALIKVQHIKFCCSHDPKENTIRTHECRVLLYEPKKKKKKKTPYLVKPIRKEEKRPVKEKEFC